MNKNISLRISGNQYAEKGFEPLIIYNDPKYKHVDKTYLGTNCNNYVIQLKQTDTITIYTLITTKVRSFNAYRNGTLMISCSIPTHVGFDKNSSLSPYKLLMEIYDKFMSIYIKNCDNDSYEFCDEKYGSSPFNEIISKYENALVEKLYPFISMVGNTTKCIVLTNEKIEQLLQNSQYKEFKNCSDIILMNSTDNNNQSSFINNLEIPRPADKYYVKINGKVDNKYYFTSETTNIKQSIKIPEKEGYESTPTITVSLDEILKEKEPHCKFNKKEHCIEINYTYLPIKKKDEPKIVKPSNNQYTGPKNVGNKNINQDIEKEKCDQPKEDETKRSNKKWIWCGGIGLIIIIGIGIGIGMLHFYHNISNNEYNKRLDSLNGITLSFDSIQSYKDWYNNNKASLEPCDTLEMFNAIEFNEKVANCCSVKKNYEELKKLKKHPGASKEQRELLTIFNDSIKQDKTDLLKDSTFNSMDDLKRISENPPH